jgi:hypothetical protein
MSRTNFVSSKEENKLQGIFKSIVSKYFKQAQMNAYNVGKKGKTISLQA